MPVLSTHARLCEQLPFSALRWDSDCPPARHVLASLKRPVTVETRRQTHSSSPRPVPRRRGSQLPEAMRCPQTRDLGTRPRSPAAARGQGPPPLRLPLASARAVVDAAHPADRDDASPTLTHTGRGAGSLRLVSCFGARAALLGGRGNAPRRARAYSEHGFRVYLLQKPLRHRKQKPAFPSAAPWPSRWKDPPAVWTRVAATVPGLFVVCVQRAARQGPSAVISLPTNGASPAVATVPDTGCPTTNTLQQPRTRGHMQGRHRGRARRRVPAGTGMKHGDPRRGHTRCPRTGTGRPAWGRHRALLPASPSGQELRGAPGRWGCSRCGVRTRRLSAQARRVGTHPRPAPCSRSVPGGGAPLLPPPPPPPRGSGGALLPPRTQHPGCGDPTAVPQAPRRKRAPGQRHRPQGRGRFHGQKGSPPFRDPPFLGVGRHLVAQLSRHQEPPKRRLYS